MLPIAGLLVANLLKMGNRDTGVTLLSFIGSVQAQTTLQQTPEPARKTQVPALSDSPVEDLKDVVALGDGRCFVVSASKEFNQVVPSR